MFTFLLKLSKSLLILFGRVFYIIGALVFYSSINALISFLSASESHDNKSQENKDISVIDEQSAQMAFNSGEISEAELVYWQDENIK